MRDISRTRAATWAIAGILSLTLALAAAARAGGTDRDAQIAFCVEAKEKALTCKEALADHFANMVPATAPAAQRDRVRAKALAEIVQEGSGPIEPRRAKCALDRDRGRRIGRLERADLAAIERCQDASDCQARVACWMAILGDHRAR